MVRGSQVHFQSVRRAKKNGSVLTILPPHTRTAAGIDLIVRGRRHRPACAWPPPASMDPPHAWMMPPLHDAW
jgi:hypothetical protein